MDKAKTVFFPLGPLTLGNDTWHAILVCRETGGADAHWGQNWEEAITEAERVTGVTDWVTLNWLANKVPGGEGRGQMVPPDTVMPLAWALANFSDSQGVTHALSEAAALPMMKAMGRVAVMKRFMTAGQSQPFHLDLINGDKVDRYTGAYDLSDGTVTVMITYSKDDMRSIYETHFGTDLPDHVKFSMGQIIDDRPGAVGHATGALYGGGFKPKLRSRLNGGDAGPIHDTEAKLLTFAFMGMPALIQGSTFEGGAIELLDQVLDVEMYPIDLV